MAKQKVVLKLSMGDAKKRAKFMHCAVGMHGVLQVTVEGDNMTVVGEGIDSVELTRLLRKKLGHVELEGVTPVEEKKEVKKVEEKKKEEVKVEAPVIFLDSYGQYVGPVTKPPYYYMVVRDRTCDQINCSIM